MIEDFSIEVAEVSGFPSRGWPLAGGTVQMQRINIAGAMPGRRFRQR